MFSTITFTYQEYWVFVWWLLIHYDYDITTGMLSTIKKEKKSTWEKYINSCYCIYCIYIFHRQKGQQPILLVLREALDNNSTVAPHQYKENFAKGNVIPNLQSFCVRDKWVFE